FRSPLDDGEPRPLQMLHAIVAKSCFPVARGWGVVCSVTYGKWSIGPLKWGAHDQNISRPVRFPTARPKQACQRRFRRTESMDRDPRRGDFPGQWCKKRSRRKWVHLTK